MVYTFDNTEIVVKSSRIVQVSGINTTTSCVCEGGNGGQLYLFHENPGKYMCILYLIISYAFFVFIFYLQDCL